MRKTGTTDQQPGSGRPRTSRTAENIDAVNDLVQSQEGAPGTHKTTHQIAKKTGISRRSVGRIIHKDIQLKCLKKRHAQKLTASNRIDQAIDQWRDRLNAFVKDKGKHFEHLLWCVCL